ncbi:hypothetical protein B0H13DRAFT_1954995 [Mycena leptocephala]|nr:hypothetical protein B0H13DRAFT_1954995 [Mycena leptocephala]
MSGWGICRNRAAPALDFFLLAVRKGNARDGRFGPQDLQPERDLLQDRGASSRYGSQRWQTRLRFTAISAWLGSKITGGVQAKAWKKCPTVLLS